MRILTPEQFSRNTRMLPLKLEASLYKAKIDIGIMVINLFKSSWTNRGFIGGSTWPLRKSSRRTNPLMYDTGALYDGFSFEINDDKITVGNDVYYAKFHNDPTGTWGPNIQRQFLGNSEYIERQVLYRLRAAVQMATEL